MPGLTHRRVLVHEQPDAVAERELEALVGVVVPRAGPLRALAGGLEDVADERVQLAAGDARRDRLARPLDRRAHEHFVRADGIRHLADDERPRHVGPAPRLLFARPHVDDDREVRRQRPGAGLVTRALPDRRDDHVRRRGRAVLPARLAQRAPDQFGGERLALEREPVAVDQRLPEQRGGGAHAGLRRGLRPADPGELRRRLRTAPGRDRRRVGTQDEPVGPQPVGHGHGQLRVDDGLVDADRRGGPRGQLQLELVVVHAALEQLVEAELGDVVEDRRGRGRGDAVALEGVAHHVHPAVDDRDQERVADRHRQLVAHRRRPLGVAVEEDVGHPASSWVLRPSSRSRQ